MADNDICIIPFDSPTGIENRTDYTKLNLTPVQSGRVNALMQQIPSMISSDTLSHAYTVKFPPGLENVHLMPRSDGGFQLTLVSDITGKIKGNASLVPAVAQTAMLGAFSAMSVASGQYFLTEINNELGKISQGIDRILEFLYGDKKAELIAEVSFAKFAYENYASIMEHEYQLSATIASLQEARKVAMKDVEFYMNDLDACINQKDGPDIVNKAFGDGDLAATVSRAFQIKECLELAGQLYAMSSLLEVYYARNYDPAYLEFVEKDTTVYLEKCKNRILSDFSTLRAHIISAKPGPLKKIDKAPLEKKVAETIERLMPGGGTDIQKALKRIVGAAGQPQEYCLCADGSVYLKTK